MKTGRLQKNDELLAQKSQDLNENDVLLTQIRKAYMKMASYWPKTRCCNWEWQAAVAKLISFSENDEFLLQIAKGLSEKTRLLSAQKSQCRRETDKLLATKS